MSNLHYTKSGALDMRYSSSRAAVASGSYGGGSSSSGNYGGGFNSSSANYGGGSGLHYTKSGALDMRYSSSRAAVASGSYGGGSSSSGNYGGGFNSSSANYGGGSGLHYTKSGALDMRYSSSRAAVSSSNYGSGSGGSSNYGGGSTSSGGYHGQASSTSDLHYKKDGTLDMRYASSRQSVSTNSRPLTTPTPTSDLHYKKDGSLDMRYASSKKSMASTDDLHYKKDGTLDMRYSSSKRFTDSSTLQHELGKMTIKNSVRGIPSHVPLTTKGLPDMRTTAAKMWVASQAANSTELPHWLPRLKDGSIDMKKSVAQEFLSKTSACNSQNVYDENQRCNYYENKMRNDSNFSDHVQRVRIEFVPLPNYEHPRLPQSSIDSIKSSLASSTSSPLDIAGTLGGQTDLNLIKSSEIDFGNDKKELGRGSFGVVLKGVWKGKTVAVKQMHLQQLTVKEKRSFVKEVTILGLLSQHVNLVTLYGYTLDPLGVVLEFVGLGSLSHLLHYNEDPKIEARMTDGRVKKGLIVDVVQGMIHLHAHNIVHGDLKPQNILVSDDYVAKIADFGLATIRGKSSTTLASKNLIDEDGGGGGTAGYMDPVLLDSVNPPELNSDVYSFGILLNEIIEEEEPYSDQYKNFLGRGPFAAANFAKLGKRPRMAKKISGGIQLLIQKCWEGEASRRPTFEKILVELKNMEIPHSF